MNIRTLIPLILISTAAYAGDPLKAPECVTTSKVELRYSPDGGCTNAIIKEIDTAKSKVLMLAYSFTSEPITEALIRAKRRGVEVQAIIDSDRLFERSNCTDKLDTAGVGVYGDSAHAIQHQKVMIIDPENRETATLILGSFNFTNAAEHSNAENIVVMRSYELATAAKHNWILHQSHSKLYAEFTPKGKPGFFEGYVHIGIFVLILGGLGSLVAIALLILILNRRKK